MATIKGLTSLSCKAPADLPRRGRWIDNGVLSNMHRGEATIVYRSLRTRHLEQAYVAAKNPDAVVAVGVNGGHFDGTFLELISQVSPFDAKRFGRPIARGGLIDTRHDWEDVCLAAMWSFQVMKYADGTREQEWLLAQERPLVEWSNWGDGRLGLAVARDGAARGRNALGRILTLLRAQLIKGQEPTIPAEDDWAAFQRDLFHRLEDSELLNTMAAAMKAEIDPPYVEKQAQLPF